MHDWLQSFVLTFVPLFIVIDALGNLPFIISLSGGMSARKRRQMVHLATITATIVGLAFLFFGQFILKVLGISFGSFAIAGGIILLVLSIKYMTTGRMVDIISEDAVAVVPLGTPLIVGPATITTLLLLAAQFPLYMVLQSSYRLGYLLAERPDCPLRGRGRAPGDIPGVQPSPCRHCREHDYPGAGHGGHHQRRRLEGGMG